MVEVYEEFSKYDNYPINGRNLLEIFYKALNTNIKEVEDTITSADFMSL